VAAGADGTPLPAQATVTDLGPDGRCPQMMRMSDVARRTLGSVQPAVAEALTLAAGTDSSVLGASTEDLRSLR